MLHVDLSPTPVQGRAELDFISDSLEPCPLDVKNVQYWEIPQLGWTTCCLEGSSRCHLLKA